jgi:hypothetical protein
LLASLVAVVVLGSTAAAASAVQVTVTNGNLKTPTTDTFEFDGFRSSFDVNQSYTIRSSSGSQTKTIEGISLEKLLQVVDADPTYSAIKVRTATGTVTVSKTQITAGRKPVLFEESGSVYFLRPSSSTSDFNAPDMISSSSSIELVQAGMPDVALAIKAKKRAKVGENLRFEAVVTAATAGARYKFTWIFGDGKTGNGGSVGHTFRKRGDYRVLLTAEEIGAERSDPTFVVVKVGPAAKSDKDRAGSGTNDSAAAPTNGAADGNDGSGDVATGTKAEQRKAKKQATESAESDLPVVSGQVLTAQAVPLEDPGIAARSGQDQTVEPNNGSGLSTDAIAGIAGVLVLLLGLLSELGVLSALRNRHREMSAAV